MTFELLLAIGVCPFVGLVEGVLDQEGPFLIARLQSALVVLQL
jgi:hypothetical protein